MNQVSGRHLFAGALLGVGVALALVQLGVSNLAGSERPAPAQLTASDIGVWTSAGPSSLSPTGSPSFWTGRATAIAADPANPNHWLAGAALGGVWETGDGGANWQPRNRVWRLGRSPFRPRRRTSCTPVPARQISAHGRTPVRECFALMTPARHGPWSTQPRSPERQ